MQIECASSDTHRSTEWEVWLLWWTTVFVWNLPPLRVFCEHRDLLLFCLAPQRAAGKSWEQWEWSLLLLLSLLLAGKCWGEELCCFRFSEGWLPGRGVGEQGDHREIISSHEVLFLPSGKVSLKADHITLKIAEQWEMPSHGPDVLFAKENYWYETW